MAIWHTLWPFGILYGHLVYFMAICRLYGHLVYFITICYMYVIYDHLVYFMVFWYIFPHFGTFYHEKSGNTVCMPSRLYAYAVVHFLEPNKEV
jgi:hypothetical protein